MKLYIKQQVFTWRDKFNVKDEFGNDRYIVEGEVFTWGKKLHVYDMQSREVVYIQQKLMAWMPRYHIYINGSIAAEIVQKFTFLRSRYDVNGPGWRVEGDFWAHNYGIVKDGTPVASIGKEWFTWGDSYALHIANPRDELLALAVLLTIDCVAAQSNSN